MASAASAPLLVRLLADACSPAASGAAAASLAVLDEAAARSNDFLKIFRSRARFPEVGWGCAPADGEEAQGILSPGPAAALWTVRPQCRVRALAPS